MSATDTGFTDKTGTLINFGDIVQLRLADHRDKSLFIVAARGNGAGLFVPGTETDPASPGINLTAEIAAVLIIVEQAGA